MNKEEQRITIAKACGWTDIFHNSFPRGWLGRKISTIKLAAKAAKKN